MIVIIPIHNQSKNIGIMLNAYMAQSVSPDFIIMVCDRCTDNSAIVANSFRDRLSKAGIGLHIIDTADYDVAGFGAGRTRDVGIKFALSEEMSGPFLFSDGDCIPSTELVAHHKEQLTSSLPRITCGLRYETIPYDENPIFELMPDNVLGMRVQDDLRVSADWCRNMVFGSLSDRLVLNPVVFERSWICWSCNLGMNIEAIRACMMVNGILDGDEGRVFNSSFDGRWGGEDGFVGLTMFRLGNEVVALSRRSHVTHIWHTRGHTSQDHLMMVARKDAQLSSACIDGTIKADATKLTGLRRLTTGAFDLGFLESVASIEPGVVLSKVIALYDEQFIAEAISLLMAGTVIYKGGLPSRSYAGDRDKLGRLCHWARSQMPWINVSVNGDDYKLGNTLMPYQEHSK